MLHHLWNQWSIARGTALWILLLVTAADLGLSVIAVIFVGAFGQAPGIAKPHETVAAYLLLFFPLVCLVTLITGWVMFARHSDAHSVIVALVPAAYLVAGIIVVVLMSVFGS